MRSSPSTPQPLQQVQDSTGLANTSTDGVNVVGVVGVGVVFVGVTVVVVVVANAVVVAGVVVANWSLSSHRSQL